MDENTVHDTYQKAATQVTFPVVEPFWMCSGFTLRGVAQVFMGPVRVPNGKSPTRLIGIYLNDKSNGDQPEYIYIIQGRGGEAQIPASRGAPSGSHGLVDLANGRKATWMKGLPRFVGQPPDGVSIFDDPESFQWDTSAPSVMLGWEIDPGSHAEQRPPLVIRLDTNAVSLSELVRIAESLSEGGHDEF